MAEINSIIDLSHHNASVDFVQAKNDGILAVIHKATQGMTYVDAHYLARRSQAAAAGLLWGAYHFGSGAEGVAQAEFFLHTVGPRPTDLLVLDFEHNPQGPSMTLEEARAFVTHIFEATGAWPGLYGGSYLKDLLAGGHDPVLANCWLWLSQYGPTAVVPANWTRWTMWQYTDGGMGPQPHPVAGIGPCDCDKFNGDAAGLRALWGAPVNIT